MTIGSGIALIVVGAILSYGVSDRISGVDLGMIGWILMGAGLVGLLLGLITQNRRRTTVVEQSHDASGTVTRQDTVDRPAL